MDRPFKPASKRLNGPQFLWDRMCAAGNNGFTVPELERETSATSKSTVKAYVLSLLAQGFLVRMELGQRNSLGHPGRRRYRVVQVRKIAPVQRRDDYQGARGKARSQLWIGMRVLRRFTIAELAESCSTDETRVSFQNARAYIAALQRAGLIIAFRKYARAGSGRGKGAQAGVYGLKPAANTGPLPPKAMRNGVFDPNTETLIRFDGEECMGRAA